MNKFDQHIKKNLSQPQIPPLDAWKNIEKELDKKKKKNKLIPIFYWIGSTAASLIIGIFYFYNYKSDSKTTTDENRLFKIVKKDSKEILNKQNNQNDSEKENITNYITSNKNIKKVSKISLNKETEKLYNISSYNPNNEHFSKKESGIAINNKTYKNSLDEVINNSESNILIKKINQNFTDSIKEDKPLELVLEEEQKEYNKEKTKSSPILAISSYVNPMKMLGSKSILSDDFNDFNVKNNTTIAYGAKVSVRLNDRINLRSGISKVDLEQYTDNVNYSQNSTDYILSNSPSRNSNVRNNINYNSNAHVFSSNYESNVVSYSTPSNQLEQKISFIEIPIELEYKLGVFKKINLLGTAGGSYYIVTKNSISVNENNRGLYKIGTAANLNNSSYSANLGVKLQYLLSEKASIDLEPNYRYMINPLQNVDNKNPSLLGINMGFSFKF